MPDKSFEAERYALEERRRAEDRRHGLRVAIFPALIAAFAAIFVGLKAQSAGAKINSEEGRKTSAAENVVTGLKTFSSLGNPNQPLSAAIPNAAAEQSSPAAESAHQQQAKPPKKTDSADDEMISTSPATLRSCYGLGSLQLERVRVEPVEGGYEIFMRLHNPASTPESLMVVGPLKLSDSKNSLDGQSNIGAGFNAPGATDQKELAGLFANGDMIAPGDATSLNLEFRAPSHFVPSKYVTFGAILIHLAKADDGTISRQNTAMSCQDVPVLPSAV